MLGSHKCTSETSSLVYSVQSQSWAVPGPSLSSPFPDSTSAILMAASSQAVPFRWQGRICVQWVACEPEASSGNGRATMCLGEHPGHKGGRFLCSGPASVTLSSGEGGARGLGWVLVPQL